MSVEDRWFGRNFSPLLVMLAWTIILPAMACSFLSGETGAEETRVAENVQQTVSAMSPATATPAADSPSSTPERVEPSPLPSDTPAPTAPQATATQPSPTPALDTGSTQGSPQDGMVMNYVPAGEFPMGAHRNEQGALPNEKPNHTANLDAFWIDQTEVTNAMYARCVQAGDCAEPKKKVAANRTNYYSDQDFAASPVIYVSWDQAEQYCKWAGRRLPTEAEWEKAARGPQGLLFPWGSSEPTCALANTWAFKYYDSWNERAGEPVGCSDGPSAVGSYSAGASPYGAQDLIGNVMEWVADWYAKEYYASSPKDNPQGPASGEYKVARGNLGRYQQQDVQWIKVLGHLYNYGDYVFNIHTGAREYLKPTYSFYDLGFRCASDP